MSFTQDNKSTSISHGSLFASRIANNESGTVAVIFALSAMLMVGVIGLSVDYGRALQARSKMQDAMDSAVLAAARQWQVDGDAAAAIARGEAQFDALKPKWFPSNRTIEISIQNSTVSGKVDASVPAPFKFMTGQNSFDVSLSSEALLTVGGNSELNIELSMMLDVTGSMCSPCTKRDDLKAAAKDLIDIIVWDDQSEFTSKVALAPFSKYVNVTAPFYQKITGTSKSNSNKTCVKERTSSSYRYTDIAPGPGKYFEKYYSDNCQPRTARIVPLSNDKNMLKNKIDALTTGGGTAGHLGTQWAWYTLSPNFNNVWPSSSRAAAYPPGHDAATQAEREAAYESAGLRKIAVIMTDGVYNQNHLGPSSSTQAAAICTNMKAKGITVYAVGFELPSQTVKNMLKACATDEDHFYDAANGQELRMSFRDIALKIAQLRLSQ